MYRVTANKPPPNKKSIGQTPARWTNSIKLNTVGSTEINACQIRADISHSGQEDTNF